jgi:hypothetical protein
LYWTRLWKTCAKWTSTVKKPNCGSMESNGPFGNSSTSWLLFRGARPAGPVALVVEVVDVTEVLEVEDVEVVEVVDDVDEVVDEPWPVAE